MKLKVPRGCGVERIYYYGGRAGGLLEDIEAKMGYPDSFTSEQDEETDEPLPE